MGAIDGLQYEFRSKSFTGGIVAGSRPDYMNYSFNANLAQYGAYIAHNYSSKLGNMQTSLAFIEQKNNGNTDRRFTYLQHSNQLIPKLYLFGSFEFDLYKKILNVSDSTYSQNNKPELTNLYLSARYKILKQLSVSLSYSARQNIIYYETYKSIVETLLEAATMKGFMFQANYRPGKNISIGTNAGYRYSKDDIRPSTNLYTYLTFNTVPWINATATLSATLLKAVYLSGSIYSINLSRDLIAGKVNTGIGYRFVNYKFANNESQLKQNMAELNLTWRVQKKLSLSVNFEGTFEKQQNYERVYVNLTQRF
jgi:hypothetical protein